MNCTTTPDYQNFFLSRVYFPRLLLDDFNVSAKMALCLYHNWSQRLHVYIGPLDTRLCNTDGMSWHCFSLPVSISLCFKSFCSVIITFISSSLSHILVHISCVVFLLLDSTDFLLLRRHITCFVTFLYLYTFISNVSNCLCIIKVTVTISWWIQLARGLNSWNIMIFLSMSYENGSCTSEAI